MTPQQYQRATDLFEDAVRRDVADRDQFLTQVCADDPEVVRAVRSMLAQHDSPAFDLDSAALGNGLNLAALTFERPTALPKTIGPFTIIDLLGAGGMSVVYRAHQTFPDRHVALKVLRHGVLSPAALRRFHGEVQTLAKLSHPNIAQIYQAGTYDDGQGAGGRPYLAMELIHGLPLTNFARQYRLNVRQKLELMIDICRAVQHAHLRGVIHRDLKPGNILVSSPLPSRGGPGLRAATNVSDDRAHPHPSPLPKGEGAIPKILDFGIARVTDADATLATLTSEAGRIIGTVPYMSPEQLAGDAAALDLRSDVYALGVVLFELLTGTLPHTLTESAPLTDVVQRIVGGDPRRLREVDRTLSSELEIIVQTALDRDRERRYQSAEALADDLQAHLEHRPIRARPPGLPLRARKWLRRHPTTATAAGLLFAAMLAIGGVILAQQRRATLRAEAELQQLLSDARQRVDAYSADLDASRRRQAELDDVHNWLYRYNPPDRALELERRAQELMRVQADHVSAFHRITDTLAAAQRLGASQDDVRRLHARLYLARAREAEAAGDRFARSMYLDLVRRHDPANELAGELVDRFPITILSDPPGAEVHMFRMVEQSEIVTGGEPRLVPVPVRNYDWSMLDLTPGDFALRLTNGGTTLKEGDLIIEINDPSQAGTQGLSIRDRVFVMSAPESSAIRPFDRLVAIDEHVVRSMYDVGAAMANQRHDKGERTFVFEQGFSPEAQRRQIMLTANDLEDLRVQVGDAAEALHKTGGRVRVWRTGDVQTLDIPPGLRFETTSKPLYLGEQSRFGATPMDGVEVERGQYIALLIKDGYEPLRVPITANDQSASNNAQLQVWRLLPRGSTPTGFVAIARTIFPDPQPFWIMQREVTISEYLDFLNDPDTRAKIDASPTPILYPRSGGIMECGRDQDGTFTLGPEFQPDWPVLGVSWNDAMAYAEWMTQEWEEGIEASRYQGIKEGSSSTPGSLDASMPSRVVFDLPTHQEWLCAWGCSGDNQFPWGMHFRPWWCASNYAREMPDPEPVMSYPIDESNLGVFDLAGSVSEWLNAWWIEERGQREFAGGSWAHGGYNYHNMFMLYGHNGMMPNVTGGTLGFRLVMRVKPPPTGSAAVPSTN